MKKVLLTSVLALSAIASVSYAATEVPSIPGVTASTAGTVTVANAKNNHNNRFGYAVSPLRKEKAINFAGAKTYPAKPYPGTDGKPLNDSTREFGHNTRFGAGFNATKSATPATPAKPEAPKKPVAVTAKKDLPSEENVTGTTNSRYGSASQTEKTAKDGQKYETFKAVETYGNTNYSYNGSYDDGKRLVTVDPNSRYGSASQKEETAKDGQQYETFKTVETFVSTNYSSVVNQ